MLSKQGILEGINNGEIYVDGALEKLGEDYIDVTLGDVLKVYDAPALDVKNPSDFKTIKIPEDGYLLQPGKLYLGRTNELTKTYGRVPLLSGLRDLAVLGIEIHITAGFGDNGFEGTWTLEIVCANPTRLYADMPIGRIYYYSLIGDSSIQYRGKYFGQIEPTESRMSNEYVQVKKLVRGDEDANK